MYLRLHTQIQNIYEIFKQFVVDLLLRLLRLWCVSEHTLWFRRFWGHASGVLTFTKPDHCTAGIFNPFKAKGMSHSYHLDQSISVLRVVGWYFSFNQILIEHLVSSGDPDQTTHFAASD